MLNLLLMLLGLVYNNGNSNVTNTNNNDSNIETIQSNNFGEGAGVEPGGDTGGQSQPIPPKK